MDCVGNLIRSLNSIARLTEAEAAIIASKLNYCEYKKYELLTEEGQVENYVYYLADGAVRNYCLNNGDDVSLDFFFSGDFTNSYMSFLTRQKSIVSVQALTDTKAFRIHYDDLQALYETSLAVNKIGRGITEALYIKRTQRELSFITKNARERYEELLQGHPELIQNIPQKYLSTFIGITPEALSRLRRVGR